MLDSIPFQTISSQADKDRISIFNVSRTLVPPITVNVTSSITTPPTQPEEEDQFSEHLLLFTGFAVGSFLLATCIAYIYCCSKRCASIKPVEIVVYNNPPTDDMTKVTTGGRTNAQKSVAPIQTVSDNTLCEESGSPEFLTTRSSFNPERNKARSKINLPIFKSVSSHLSYKNTSEKLFKRVNSRLDRVGTVSRVVSSRSPIYLDPKTITAEMLNPNKIVKSNREFVLFKAPSFSE